MEYLSITWYEAFMSMILSSLIMTNLTPYIGVCIDLCINRVCRKQKRSKKYFQFDRKNAQILATIFVTMTYGFGVPVIFIYLMMPLLILAIFDRVLLVYWFKPYVM